LTQSTVAFFDSTFEEALALTREARDYLTHGEPRQREHMTPNDRMLASCESMRLTSRLTQVMAWLLVQKAVHAGEMSREEAKAEEFRLAGKTVCEETKPPVEGSLQPRLAELLDRSHHLYQRVSRLDALQDPPERRFNR
jgi:regulator of CtrA degradation